MDQHTATEASPLKSGLFHRFRCFYYRHDAVEGTKANLIPCGTTTFALAGAGACAGGYIAQNITVKTLEEGANLADRVVAKIEGFIKEYPMVIGAMVGGAAAVTGIHMLGSSLKPIVRDGIESVRDGIESVRDGLRCQLQKQRQLISHHQDLIEKHRKAVEILIPHLPEENAVYQRMMNRSYQVNLQRYNHYADSKAAELKAYIKEIIHQREIDLILQRNSNSWFRNFFGREAPRKYPREFSEVRLALSTFMQIKNYESQKDLLKVLKSVLTDVELGKVRCILSDFPFHPDLWMTPGFIETSIDDLHKQISSEKKKIKQIELRIKQILQQYSTLQPDENERIPYPPPVEEFNGDMPD
ncbi:hypothetical protein [Endozoicomonas sp. SCSIO W0465]|uniref:hypothetical protein n=1 Tax=Endozoicomonas sp. SCSIO W0465 TaxID=2918516 RepID=UPI0020758868|nr:hypothetical protein [Endozoicomonas sp. SCSIO W0465]USE33961.1 hypothetical protein MJO57_17505 [Endozoicomonas sp. SCSIO W0465]